MSPFQIAQTRHRFELRRMLDHEEVGQVVKPWRRTIRRRTLNAALARIREIDSGDLFESANSYFGLLRQATRSHADRARLANLVRRRGLAVNHQLMKAYR